MEQKQNQELLVRVQDKFVPFMRNFDAENRGNRLSKEIIAGFGGFLENLVMEILEEELSKKKGQSDSILDTKTDEI